MTRGADDIMESKEQPVATVSGLLTVGSSILGNGMACRNYFI
jgi:hypothetical protein